MHWSHTSSWAHTISEVQTTFPWPLVSLSWHLRVLEGSVLTPTAHQVLSTIPLLDWRAFLHLVCLSLDTVLPKIRGGISNA